MKRLYILSILLVVAVGCSTESSVGPVKSDTFVRYFNGTYSDEAESLIESADKGLIVLANTLFPAVATTATDTYRINLIKTDAFGNLVWQEFFPAITASSINLPSYKAHGIAINPAGGYVLIGEAIQSTGSKLLLITVDSEGKNPNVKIMDTPAPRTGIGVAVTTTGNFMVVASITDQLTAPTNNLMLGEFDKTTLLPLWNLSYGAGQLVDNFLPNRLYLDAQNNSYWGGSVLKNSVVNNMRFIKVPPASLISFLDVTLGDPTIDEKAGDMIRYGSSFAFVGTQNKPDSSRIIVRRASEGGTQIFSQAYNVNTTVNDLTTAQSLTANSLCVAQDGGLVLLSTAGRTTSKDLCLVKIDAFGNPTPLWRRTYGGRFDDEGKTIITSSDGGHVVLGTTNLANVKTLLLLKTDKEGKIPGL